jgi:hypothetical protein
MSLNFPWPRRTEETKTASDTPESCRIIEFPRAVASPPHQLCGRPLPAARGDENRRRQAGILPQS